MIKNTLLITIIFLLAPISKVFAEKTFNEVSIDLISQSNGLLSQANGPANAASIKFKFDPLLNTYSTSDYTDPEVVQSWFKFDWNKFMADQGTDDPLVATRTYYRDHSKHTDKLRLHTDQPTLDDWMGLIHPPVRDAVAPALNQSGAFNDVTFHRQVDLETNTHLTAGNSLVLIKNGDTFKEKIRMLKEAKKYFWGSSLLFSCDKVTEPLMDLMIKRSIEGLDVRLIVDGTLDHFGQHACTQRLKRAGIQLVRAKGFLFKKSAFHIKIWIRDGEEAMVDGANTIDSEAGSTGYNHLYRDTGVLVKGPAATDLTQEMIRLIRVYGGDTINTQFQSILDTKIINETNSQFRGAQNYQSWLKNPKGVCRVVVQSAPKQYDRVSKTFELYLKNSEKSFFGSTITKLFNFDDQNSSAPHKVLFQLLLKKSQQPQFKANLLVNTWMTPFSSYYIKNAPINDEGRTSFITKFVRNRRNKKLPKIVEAIYEQPNQIEQMRSTLQLWSHFQYSHSKIIFFDEEVVSIGSFNLFEDRSDRDAEVAILCQDPELTQAFHHASYIDLLNSIPILGK